MIRTRLAVQMGFAFGAAIIIVSMFISGCRRSQPDPGAVADTDLGIVSFAELEEHILSLPVDRRMPAASQSSAQWHRQLLEGLIVDRVLEAEARSLSLAETEEWKASLAARMDPFLTEITSRRMISEKVHITEEDLRTFYDAHPEDFSHPEQIRVRNIYRRVSRDAPPETWQAARVEMEGLLARIHEGARFGSLAREHSDSETAPLDGLIGRLDRGKLAPEIEQILWELNEGEVSDVIRTPVGFQIFKVEAQIGRFKMEYVEARTRINRRLVREATEKAETAILRELIGDSGASYHPERFDDGTQDAILFSLGNDSVTVSEFLEHLWSIGFFASREPSPRLQLDKFVLDRLYLWQAERSGLINETAIVDQLNLLEKTTLISMALQERTHAQIENLDEKDLKTYFDSRKGRFNTPRLLHLRILTRDFAADEDWYTTYEELEALADEIRSGRREFAPTAEEISTDYSAVRGGDVGFVRATAFSNWAGPHAQRRVLQLSPGELSEPILIERYDSNQLTYERMGYMLVLLEGIQEPRERSFDEVRDRVVDQYLEHHGEEISAQIRSDILDSVHTEIHSENL